MSDLIAFAILSTAAAYAASGICFAIAFVLRGIQRIDPAAQHSGLPFRVILLPGAAVLWPVLLHRWRCAEKKP